MMIMMGNHGDIDVLVVDVFILRTFQIRRRSLDGVQIASGQILITLIGLSKASLVSDMKDSAEPSIVLLENTSTNICNRPGA